MTIRGTLVLVTALGGSSAVADEPPETVVRGPLSPGDGLTVAGRVIGGEAPVDVELWRWDFGAWSRWTAPHEPARASVPSGGAFRFTGLAPGRYSCDFADERMRFGRSARVVDLVRDLSDVDLVVASACRVKGRVVRATKFAEGTVMIRLGESQVRAAPDGSFETPDVLPGDYRLVVQNWLDDSEDGLGNIVRTLPIRIDGVRIVAIDLTRDESVSLTIASSRAGESLEGTWTVDGGSPWDTDLFFRVTPSPDGKALVRRSYPGMFGDAWSASATEFPVAGFARGSHRLRLDATGFATWERDVVVAGPTRVAAEMTALDGEYFTLAERPAFMRVEVRQLRGAWRELVRRDDRRHGLDDPYVPDPHGFLAPGRYEWRAESSDGPPTQARELVVTAARDVVELRPDFQFRSREMRGRLVTASGVPLGGVCLKFAVKSEAGEWRALPTKDTPTKVNTGEFRTSGLGPGRWRVSLDDAGAITLAEFDVADEDVTKELVFRAR